MSDGYAALVHQRIKRDISETQLPYELMRLLELCGSAFLAFFRLAARRERLDDFDLLITFFLIARNASCCYAALGDFRPDRQHRTRRLSHDAVGRADLQVRKRK